MTYFKGVHKKPFEAQATIYEDSQYLKRFKKTICEYHRQSNPGNVVTENITGLLKYNEVNSFWGSKEAYKEFDYEWDYSNNMGFIVTNAKIRRNDDLDQANISTENVFQHLSFRNVKINFAKSDGTNAHSKYFNFKPTKDKSYRVLKKTSLNYRP